MQHEHREGSCIKNPRLQSDVQHNELDKSLAAHQRANCTGLAPIEAAQLCRNEATEEFADECDYTDKYDVAPRLPGIE